ncbi:hypothetical protein AFCA_009784 [Aspergillus flavus]|uniref:Uncharacterized protein n=1 Tax=Aspergillus flavus TaxID=5059 RepID=A0AB74C6Y1_ASPFL|nr:hypothetical protein COH20_011498 [Aspergillus flavus]RAQ81160.1 hypothetical protein COH21_013054 [Aspergillus flavus]RMZ42410.1 hypothetical protein CA14_002929 [Aspergillus flavus]UDD62471.1 hypothetical protein AFCA_009784 [Aspergillus flavus]
MSSFEDQIRSRQRFALDHIAAIDTERESNGYNNDNKFWHQSRLFMQNISSRYTKSDLPIDFYEYDMRELWYMIIQGAKITDAKHPAQDRLAGQILHAREMGVLHRMSATSGVEEEASTSKGKIWVDLPFLTQEFQVAWNAADELPAKQRQNLSAFIARLSAWGVCGSELCVCALSIFRDTFETRRPLTATDDQQGNSLLPIADLLPAAVAWFELCGYKIENLCLSGHGFESSTLGELAREAQVVPDTGFSTSRWLFWRRRLEEISHCDHAEMAALAQWGVRVMQCWGERILAIDNSNNQGK